MLLETYQRRLHYNDSDEEQDVGLELAKRARLEKYMQREVIIAQRQGAVPAAARPITSVIRPFMKCCGR
ncbi:hypothetical protein LNO81_19130 [Klebsiella variicola subsp. variicola]|nr:hypothetical protein [Klebsiella variicola subsp. variicola]